MVLTEEVMIKMLEYHHNGKKPPTIEKMLRREGIKITRVGVWKFLRRYKKTGTIARKEGTGRKSKLSPEIRKVVDDEMTRNDETTAYQLQKILCDKEVQVSVSSALRYIKALGWTYHGSAYCQLIREVNKMKRLAWAKQHLHEAEDGFDDVIWTDESSVQCDTHKRFCYRKKHVLPKNKPRQVRACSY